MRKEMTLQVPIAEIYLESIFLSNQKFTDWKPEACTWRDDAKKSSNQWNKKWSKHKKIKNQIILLL
jgi:uncharacterized protein with von Willebrand factor type A (vWA) domain